MALDLEKTKQTISEIQRIVNRIDHLLTLVLNDVLYNDGVEQVRFSDEQKNRMKARYTGLKAELEQKISELP